MNEQNTNELRIKRGSKILEYIKHFSATEKAVFAGFVLLAIISAIWMASLISDYFMVEVPAEGGSLNEGLVGLPRTINPVLAITDVDKDLSALIYSGLMKYDGNDIVPDLAESYKISEDGLTYTFKLREGVKFHDKEKLTADDIVFTIQKIQNSTIKSPKRGDWLDATVEVISENEVKFTLKQPYAPFLSNTTIGIIPKHIWSTISDSEFIFSKYNTQPIGSGPYKITSISRDGEDIPISYSLKTWSRYYGDRPNISVIDFTFFADEEKALDALMSGAITSLSQINSKDSLELSSYKNLSLMSSPLPRVFGMFINQSHNVALSDKAVRKALDLAVNRDEIIAQVLYGYGMPIPGPLPYGMSSSTATTTFNIEKANSILEKAGWKKNNQGIFEKKSGKNLITLSFDIYTADTTELKMTADLVKADWEALGAKVNIKIFESSDLFQSVIRTRSYDALLFGQLIGKDRDLYAFWHSSQRNAPGLNVSLYANSKADKLLEDIRTINNEFDKASKYTQFAEIIKEDMPAIFLYVPNFTYAVPKNVKGIDLDTITTASDRWNTLEDWYIDTERVWKIFKNY